MTHTDVESNQRPNSKAAIVIGRTVALVVGLFSALNVFGELRRPGFDANIWWIDLRPLTPWLADSLLVLLAFTLVWFALNPVMSKWRAWSTQALLFAFLIVSVVDGATYFLLIWRNDIRSDAVVPFSLFVSCTLLVILVSTRGRLSQKTRLRLRDFGMAAATVFTMVIAFPLLQVYCFGQTDYRRQADAAVVLGCRVFANGQLSRALDERVRRGCQLYHDGLVEKLIFSGGPGEGQVHETIAMRNLAIKLGVLPNDILLDSEGVDTRATATNTTRMFRKLGMSRVLVVSHFYHLPRIKLSYRREGYDVFTVPCEMQYRSQLPFQLLREVAALWLYYLRPLSG